MSIKLKPGDLVRPTREVHIWNEADTNDDSEAAIVKIARQESIFLILCKHPDERYYLVVCDSGELGWVWQTHLRLLT